MAQDNKEIDDKCTINNPYKYPYPIIYIYTVPDDAHHGLVKIGLTHGNFDKPYQEIPNNDSSIKCFANKRIKQQTKTGAFYYDLRYCTIAITKNGNEFSDDDVHHLLGRYGIYHQDFKDEGIDGGDEWFPVDVETAINYINTIKNESLVIENTAKSNDITLRPSQQEAINKALTRYVISNQFLWACKMRFGKTFSALKLITSSFKANLNFNSVCIFTTRPGVKKEWFSDFNTLGMANEGYKFYSKELGCPLKDDVTKKEINKDALNDKCIVFYSMQDLKGSASINTKSQLYKNELLLNVNWNLIIIDEADEGTTSELGENLINKLKAACPNAKWLYLSGTPYRIYKQFTRDEIYSWSYTDEQKAKEKYQSKLNNPYANLPQLKLFLINLKKDMKLSTTSYIDHDDKYFSFDEFFKCAENNKHHFLNEEVVNKFLNLLIDHELNEYPFSNENYRNYFKHTFWCLPSKDACNALEELLKHHPFFGNGNYAIVNLSANSKNPISDEHKVEKAIKNNERTITLSVRKMTRGATVGQWTAILYLTGGSSTSVSQYMQTIFRVQSPFKDEKTGKIKTEGYIFDFAPERALNMQWQLAKIQKETENKTIFDEIIEENLRYLPVITYSNNSFKSYDVDELISQVKQNNIANICNNGFWSTDLINSFIFDKLSSEEADWLNEINKEKNSSKLQLNTNGTSDVKKTTKKETIKPKKTNHDKKNDEVNYDNLKNALLTIATRVPFLIYGAYDWQKDINIDNITTEISDETWEQFIPQSITKERFNTLIKCFDKDLFNACAKKINDELRQTEDNNLSIEQRIIKITALLATFQNPSKETVLTPWRVINMHLGTCIGGWNFLDEDYKNNSIPHFINLEDVTMNIYAKDQKILDIYSKEGLYSLYNAYTFFRLLKKEQENNQLVIHEKAIWKQVIENNIYALCQTAMAKAITERTLIGLNKNISPNIYLREDLIDKLDQNNFQEIQDNMAIKIKNNEIIHFDAIVGNPPYSKLDSPTNPLSHTPIYPKFVELAIKLQPKYFSYIIPKTWEVHNQGKEQIKKINKLMLSDGYLSTLYNFNDASNLFNNVEIGGGVCFFLATGKPHSNEPKIYFLDDKTNKFEKVFTSEFAHYRQEEQKYYDKHDVIFLLASKQLKSIFDKVFPANHKLVTFDTIVKKECPYGIRPAWVKTGKDKTPIPHQSEPFKNGILVYEQNYHVQYTDVSNIHDKNNSLHKYKCLIGKASKLVNSYPAKVMSTLKIAKPNEACTESFLEVGVSANLEYVKHIYIYIANSLDYLKVSNVIIRI